MSKILLDTDVLIDVLRGRDATEPAKVCVQRGKLEAVEDATREEGTDNQRDRQADSQTGDAFVG